MREFHKLVMLGVLLVTLLLVIDTIDAGKKKVTKKELDAQKQNEEEGIKLTSKSKRTESIKLDKIKKTGSQRTENYEEENEYVGKNSRFATQKPNIKKNIKFTTKDKKYTENANMKTTKQKLKKSKIFHEEPAEKFSSKTKAKKTKPQYVRSENIDKIVKTVKKTTQKKLIEENENIEKILSEELNRLKNEEIITVEEATGGDKKKRKFKLVEVVLEDDGEEEMQEGNETSTEIGLEEGQDYINIESEEIIEKTRSIHNPKSFKDQNLSKKLYTEEEEQNDGSTSEDNYFNNTEEAESVSNEESSSEIDNFATRYIDKAEESCQRIPEDPNRKGPKKLTLYVVEEEIDGQVRKRVVSEEDGVTMCEVADLLKESYNMAIPEE